MKPRALGRIPAMLTMLTDLARGAYPSAVYGRAPRARELPPVFTFHEASRSALEPLMASLADQGIRTLNCDEYLAAVRGERSFDAERSLMLTFDDGEASLWSDVYPLLQRYSLQAVAFLIPGRIQHDKRTAPGKTLCSWPQIREMHGSGLVDFQSHTLLHHRVFVGTRILDFVNPELVEARHPHDLLYRSGPPPADSELPLESYPLPPLGAPIYASRPRMAAKRAIREDPRVRELCVARVREDGGRRFFELSDWRRRLESMVSEHGETDPDVERTETEEQRDRALVDDLRTARQMIERHLPEKQVLHLAWPWGVAGDAAEEAARRAGYEACYWGRCDGRLANVVGGDPMRLARIGEDFLCRMAGPDQPSLARLLFDKLRRRTVSTRSP